MTAEPYEIEKQGVFQAQHFLAFRLRLLDYSTLIEFPLRDIVEKNPDLVQRPSTPPRSAGITISMATIPRPTR